MESLENQVIAMSNILAEKSTRFSVIQQKLFYLSLASLKHGINDNNEVEIDKQELFDYLDISNQHDRYTRVREELDKLVTNSFIKFRTNDGYRDGCIICSTGYSRNSFCVKFNDDYLPLVQRLADNFVRLLDDDLISFGSKFSMMLYQHLLIDRWKLTNIDFLGIDYSTKQLKEMFGLKKDDYVKKNGNFNRTLFEQKTIDKALEEINEKSKCIKNLTYQKIKKGNRVQYYLFTFSYRDSQILAKEIPEKKSNKEADNLNWWEQV